MNWLVDADVRPPEFVTGVEASGGEESVINVQGQLFRVHTFTSSGTLNVTSGGTAEVLVVGGGGAGGRCSVITNLFTQSGSFRAHTGGGGAGGVVNSSILLSATAYGVVVGNGGVLGNPGQDSLIGLDSDPVATALVTAKGGGGGGVVSLIYTTQNQPPTENITPPTDGGSGAGGLVFRAPFRFIAETQLLGSKGIQGQGFDGGNPISISAGGGGGFSKAGARAQELRLGQPSTGGNGGTGQIFNFDGQAITIAGGGGGASLQVGGIGGDGGGGDGASGNNQFPHNAIGQNGSSFGAGGGGGSTQITNFFSRTAQGGSGSAGIVIIRYPIGG